MINLAENRKNFDDEKKRLLDTETYDEDEEKFHELLDELEDDPEYAKLVARYRDAEAAQNRCIMRRKAKKNKETETRLELAEWMSEVKGIADLVEDARAEILEKYFKGILKRES